ncbi:MAG: sugar ABC transporter permease [Actinomycetota bacterium]|nr:sugar ABC transporter permease [Actinomycetota bacterium]
MAPAVVLLALLDVVPILTELFYSFTNFSLLKPPRLVGLAEYEALFSDPVFWASILRTFYFAAVLVVVGVAVSLGVAVLLSQTILGTTVHRIVIFLPQTVSYAAGALIWIWLFNPTSGPIDTFLSSIGGPTVGWLTSPSLAMPSLIIVSLWRDTGYYMLVFLAALANVPNELYEAAHLDGAGPLRTFRTVVLPSIRPAMLFVLLTWSFGALQMFTQAYVMTNGGPGNATLSVVLDIYQQGFEFLRLGYASAESFVVFVLCLAISMIYVRRFRRMVT